MSTEWVKVKSGRDYYKVLGIDRNATESQIKAAFRKLAFKYHPDRNHEPRAEENFKKINEAHETLSNPEKRDTYDASLRVVYGKPITIYKTRTARSEQKGIPWWAKVAVGV